MTSLKTKIVVTSMLIIGLGLIVYPQIFPANGGFSALTSLGVAIIITAIAILNYKKLALKNSGRNVGLSSRIFGGAAIVVLAVTLILEALPSSTVMVFYAGPDKGFKETFSHFSSIPMGYANYFPFLTAILTIVITVLSLIAIVKRVNVSKLKNATFILTIITSVLSVIPVLIFGKENMSIVGTFITFLLLVSLALQALSKEVMLN